MQNFDEILLHMYCKEEIFVVTHLSPHKKNQEKKKLNKKRNPKKQDDIHEESLEDCPS
jgi:hypothetical protein